MITFLFFLSFFSDQVNTRDAKRFFSNFAQDSGFDPLFPENWYPMSSEQIYARKVLYKKRDRYQQR